MFASCSERSKQHGYDLHYTFEPTYFISSSPLDREKKVIVAI